ncbi:ATP synthase F0 [Seiridium cupressi]
MSSPAEEERPLLGREPSDHADAHRRRVIAMSFAMVILVDFAAFFLDAPQTSILESRICNRYYSSNPGPTDCTAGPVQAELATVNQMLNTFNRLPGLIVAIPFGILADRYGRRPVLIMVIIGALFFVGGGDAVASGMIFLVVADVALPRQRANLFFLLTACGLISEVIATPLSAMLMLKNPWIPYFIYTGLTLLGRMVPLFLLPETLRKSTPEPEPSSCDTEEEDGRTAAANSSEPSLRSALSSSFSRFRPLMKRNVIAILLAFFASALGRLMNAQTTWGGSVGFLVLGLHGSRGELPSPFVIIILTEDLNIRISPHIAVHQRQSTSFLLQYIRQRFNWKYEKASLLITLRAAVNLALLLLELSALNKLLVKYKMSTPHKDLFISRLSVALFALGSLVI